MKIVVVSDNHGNKNHLIDIISMHPDADSCIHLGDSEFQYHEPVLKPFEKVGGNCDFDMNYPNEAVLETPVGQCFYTHGHLYSVNRNREQLAHIAKERNCKFAFYGHTHIKNAELIDGVWCINPGSISQSRDHHEETYAILTLEQNAKVTYYNQKHIKVEEITLEN